MVTDVEVATPEVEAVGEVSLPDKATYEEYQRMTPLKKAQSCGFTRLRNYEEVEGIVKLKFIELGHVVTVDELVPEELAKKIANSMNGRAVLRYD